MDVLYAATAESDTCYKRMIVAAENREVAAAAMRKEMKDAEEMDNAFEHKGVVHGPYSLDEEKIVAYHFRQGEESISKGLPQLKLDSDKVIKLLARPGNVLTLSQGKK